MAKAGSGGAWDLPALLNAAAHAAQPRSSLVERNLWLVRALEWLRHAPLTATEAPADGSAPLTLRPVLRLKHLLNVLERNPQHRSAVAALLARFWLDVDTAALFADFGFSPRTNLLGELAARLKLKLLPLTPATTDLGELFGLLFPAPADAAWLDAVDAATLGRLVELLRPAEPAAGAARRADEAADWRQPMLDAIMFLASTVRASGFSGPLRQRMSAELLADQPFRQLASAAEQVRLHALAGDAPALLRSAQYLRALLDSCRRCADSVHEHLEEHGVSLNIVFEVDQLRERTHRIEQLLNCVLSDQPAVDVTRLLAELVRAANERRSVRALFASHYSLLARKVAERSAATGEHYITRDRHEYSAMLGAAAGGGLVIAGTTFMKFAVLALGLSAFWGGFWAGMNYAVSFLIVHLLHWTVATKQPAMTAPAMADKLAGIGREARRGDAPGQDDAAVEGFVDEVAHLIRSQAAGIFGNLGAVIPVVLAAQFAAQAAFGRPLVSTHDAQHVIDTITLLGPTAFFAAFTGVLLFASSIVAGWIENWFVLNKLDSAIAWNPRIVARLGEARARRWAAWWRANIAGLASNTVLGLMLGIVPVVLLFFGLPIEVRHVTLSTGQLAAAVSTLGFGVMTQAPFWWCVAGIAVTGVLNLTVSFFFAFRVALRSRGTRLVDRSRIYRAIRHRLRTNPASFIVPPRHPGVL